MHYSTDGSNYYERLKSDDKSNFFVFIFINMKKIGYFYEENACLGKITKMGQKIKINEMYDRMLRTKNIIFARFSQLRGNLRWEKIGENL